MELLVHPLGQTGSGAEYATDPAKRPGLVLDSLRAFAEAGIAADVWKLESPLPTAQIPDPGAAWLWRCGPSPPGTPLPPAALTRTAASFGRPA